MNLFRILYSCFLYILSLFFRLLCFKEYCFPNEKVRQVCGSHHDKVSVEARTLYWLFYGITNLRISIKEIARISDPKERFEKLREYYTKTTTKVTSIRRTANLLSKIFADECNMEEVTLPTCKKPNFFFRTTENVEDSICLLYYHGGAYIQSSNMMLVPNILPWVLNMKCNLYCASYDFCPDNSLENLITVQAMESYKYLTQVRKIKPENIIVIGESAGGNLAINVAKLIGKQGCAGCILASPWLDLTNSFAEETDEKYKLDCLLSKELVIAATTLVSRDSKAKQFSPYFWSVDELNQLPPLFISVSQSEKLIVEYNSFKKLLQKTVGLYYELEDEYYCLVHAYGTVSPFVPEVKKTYAKHTKFIQKCIELSKQSNKTLRGQQ